MQTNNRPLGIVNKSLKSRLIALGRHSQDRITSLNNSFIGSINRQAKVVVLEDIDCLDPPAHNSSEVTALSFLG